MPITHTQVTGEDSMLELGVKVLSNTASAILQVRDQLNREVIDRATDLLAGATSVELYAVGLAMRHARPKEGLSADAAASATTGAQRSAPGVSTAAPLARLTSHSRWAADGTGARGVNH